MKIRGYLTGRAAAVASALIAAGALLFLAALPLAAVAARTASDEAEVRGVVEQVFNQLKSGQYEALYDALPADSRKRISRERFSSALRRTEDMYKLDRLEVGRVRVSGDHAVADTVMYGRLLRPVQSDGKIVAQQYLVREDGRWRVATGERATVRSFLSANPKFARKFPIREPRIYMKRDGRWVDVSKILKTAVRKQTKKG
ncbi:MAG TPA: hypothetical protein VF708_16660 [Pyrinomonadaceae bacterium]